jgi:hypothetical protein
LTSEECVLFEKKTEVVAEFIIEYWEGADWEWLTFLEEREEVQGFEWAYSKKGSPLGQKVVCVVTQNQADPLKMDCNLI